MLYASRACSTRADVFSHAPSFLNLLSHLFALSSLTSAHPLVFVVCSFIFSVVLTCFGASSRCSTMVTRVFNVFRCIVTCFSALSRVFDVISCDLVSYLVF